MMRIALQGLLLVFLTSCGDTTEEAEEAMGPTPKQVRTLIQRFDVRLQKAEATYVEFVDILKQGDAVKSDYEYAVEVLEREHELAEKVVVYEGTKYKANESSYLKHQAVALLFSYLNMTKTELLDVYNGDDSNPNETLRNNRMVLNTFRTLYNNEKKKLLEAFPE